MQSVGDRLATSQSIAYQFGRQRAMELLYIVTQIGLKSSRALNPGAVPESPRRFNGLSIAIPVTPTANRIVIFERKAERIDPRVAVAA